MMRQIRIVLIRLLAGKMSVALNVTVYGSVVMDRDGLAEGVEVIGRQPDLTFKIGNPYNSPYTTT